MERSEVFDRIRTHLAEELEVPADEIEEATRLREDLDADSLDLYTLLLELEDSYGVKIPEDRAADIETVGQAVDEVTARLTAT